MATSTRIVFTLFLTLAGSALQAGVTLYRDSGFRGRHETFLGDIADLRGTLVGNDRVSAVAVEPGCSVRLFEHVGFRGRSVVLTGDEPDMRRSGLGNDRVSSLRIRCHRSERYEGRRWSPSHHDRQGPAAVLYRDAGFRGVALALDGEIARLGRTALGNDRLSSVDVAPGCELVVYRDSHFRGQATSLRGAHKSLRWTAIGNDRASSAEVLCH